MSYQSLEVLYKGQQQVVGESKTDAPLSGPNPIQISDPLNVIVDIVVSAIVVAVGVTAKLQTQAGDGAWQDSKTLALTTTGTKTIKITQADADDAAYLPIRPKMRVVVTTGAGDAVTVDSVIVSKRY